jgi:hypothetical protein
VYISIRGREKLCQQPKKQRKKHQRRKQKQKQKRQRRSKEKVPVCEWFCQRRPVERAVGVNAGAFDAAFN